MPPLIVNNELGKQSWCILRYSSSICLEQPVKSRGTPRAEWKLGPPKCKVVC